MTEIQSGRNRFIEYLENHRNDRAMLAALRRGLGQSPGAVPDVSKYVQPWLADNAPAYVEEAYYLIAPLFALHPIAGGCGNMGAHFAALCDPDREPPSSVERRFILLLSAHPEDLPDCLRQAVGLLKSKQVPVNWRTLLKDVLDWKRPDEAGRIRVRRKWSRDFWRRRDKTAPTPQGEPIPMEEGE